MSVILFCDIVLLLLCFGVCWGGVWCRRDNITLITLFLSWGCFFCGIFLWVVVFINCMGQLINTYHSISHPYTLFTFFYILYPSLFTQSPKFTHNKWVSQSSQKIILIHHVFGLILYK